MAEPNLIEYKCPQCGGVLEFDSATQQMKCPYCDSVFSVESLQSKDEVLENTVDGQWELPNSAWAQSETDHMAVYTCKSCGGEIIADETTGATHCPFCDNPVVMTGQFAGDLRPDLVLPFQLDKAAAKAALKQHMSGKRLLPKAFSRDSHLDEVKGVYVPVWLYDAKAHASMLFEATRSISRSDGQFRYTDTERYDVVRAGDLSFENVPADGSTKMPDELMESLEPFDVGQAKPFQTAYLSGYLADRYDVDAARCETRAKERIRRSTEEVFSKTVTEYDSARVKISQIRTTQNKVRYALYPVWLLNTTWQGQQYRFAMNGQTGKFVGDMPADNSLYWKLRAAWAAGIAAVVYGVVWLVTHL